MPEIEESESDLSTPHDKPSSRIGCDLEQFHYKYDQYFIVGRRA